MSLLLSTVVVACQMPLRIEPSSLPDARVGESYRAEIVVERASTPIAGIDVLDGELPDGLEIAFERHQESAPAIEGTPARAGTYDFRIHVSCFGTNFPGQTGEQTMTIVVHDAPLR